MSAGCVRWERGMNGALLLYGVSGLEIASIRPGKLPCCGPPRPFSWDLDGFIWVGRHGHADTREEARAAVVKALDEAHATAREAARMAPLP